MDNFGCGDGGWTPVMKIDGNKVSYKFNHLRKQETQKAQQNGRCAISSKFRGNSKNSKQGMILELA